tara:strand:+ start:1 stop:3420 length:3420 start_codon:yes stop_codon:yes gene_type:complete
MKNPCLFGLMAILLLGGTITPALSQSSPDSVVINEVEINPTNGAEFIELYNPTSQPIDVGGWSITPSSIWKKYEIPSNTIIESESFLAFTHSAFWFKDFGDIISLTNNFDELIDTTPLLADEDDDSNSWQRSVDGLDTDSASDWELKRMTPKSSNGKLIETAETTFSFIAQIDKSEYIFGDTVTISGSISESLFSDNYYANPEIIKIKIDGPDYYNNLALFPDRNLNFSTELNIKEIFGFNLGDYDVSISYGDNSVKTKFIIVEEQSSLSAETGSQILEIFTDKESYIPGETVILFANTDSQIEYAGLEYVILDPTGNQFSSGTIFPNSQFSIVHKSGGGQLYPFSTQLLMHDVNPVYGTYEIQGVFGAQDPIYRSAGVEITTSATFELVEDVKEDVTISLFTDKEIYESGDIVKITGRSNEIWTEDLELQIIQTGIFESKALSYSPFNEKFSIKLNGDGTFEYNFKIPTHTQDNLSHGDYLIKISEYFGQNTKHIKVVENPESFVDIRTPLGLKMDESKYVLGTAITISGKVLDYEQNENTYNHGNEVRFTFTDPNGMQMMSKDRIQAFDEQYAKSPNDELTFTAMPDEVGTFKIDAILHPLQFDIGEYTVTANHLFSKKIESIQFEIVTAQSELLPITEPQEPLTFELCSSTSGIETIKKDLKQIGKDDIPPSMESVNCDGTADFATGEKLVIRGKVALKDPRSLADSETNSGQMQSGHSYTINYAQAELNYIQLSIPYPQTLIVSTSYQTSDETGEYHGGGGTGGAGVATGDAHDDDHTSTGIGDSSGIESNRNTGYDGQVVLREVTKNLTDMNMKVYPDSEGNFFGVFDLRAGIFADGIYKLKADYYGYKSEQSFLVIDNSLKGGLQPELILNFDRNEYVLGEIVSISGKIKNVYYYDSVSLKIETPDISTINCLVGQQCGFGNTEKKIRVSEGTDGATFFMNYKIPSDSMIGKYTVVADTHFGQIEKSFFVINDFDVVNSVPSLEPSSKVSKIIEKFNRIAGNEILITLDEKSTTESTLVPRVIQGSLFTSARGEESSVNLRITTTNGQCVIGPDSNCLVTESTRKPGEIYSLVSIDDVNYNIRYSGNDVRLEKFSIVPEDSNLKIDIDTWNIEIIKDDQPSRFYYKVSYVALQ